MTEALLVMFLVGIFAVLFLFWGEIAKKTSTGSAAVGSSNAFTYLTQILGVALTLGAMHLTVWLLSPELFERLQRNERLFWGIQFVILLAAFFVHLERPRKLSATLIVLSAIGALAYERDAHKNSFGSPPSDHPSRAQSAPASDHREETPEPRHELIAEPPQKQKYGRPLDTVPITAPVGELSDAVMIKERRFRCTFDGEAVVIENGIEGLAQRPGYDGEYLSSGQDVKYIQFRSEESRPVEVKVRIYPPVETVSKSASQ